MPSDTQNSFVEEGKEMHLFNNSPFLVRLVSASVKIAERAGLIIRQVSAGDLKVVEKGKNDLQTEADRAAQYCIVRSLRSMFGDELTVIGEEESDECLVPVIETGFDHRVLSTAKKLPDSLAAVTARDVVVWVDPLDGTNEFAAAKENPALAEQTTTLIGIAFRGIPIAGVVHQPFYGINPSRPTDELGRTLWAIKGCGFHGSALVPIDESRRLVVTTRSHGTGTVSDAIDAATADGLCNEVLRVGGAGYKVLQLLLYGAHAYLFASPGCKKWDTCAPQALLEAAGGRLTDVHGDDIDYSPLVQRQNSGGVIATAPKVDHERYLKAMPQRVKDALPAKL